MTQSPDRPRRVNEAYDLHDTGNMKIVDAGPWWPVGDVWRRIVLVDAPARTNDPKPLVFVVRFQRGTDEVSEAYYDVRH